MRSGYKVYSQCDEDGIIAEIFRRIGVTSRMFLEFGVERGIECNTLWLLMNGWRGAWIEANDEFVAQIMASHEHWIIGQRLFVLRSFVRADNINTLITNAELPKEIDFLSIDIDLNDYWVWEAINVILPRVVCIEYNATWLPPSTLVVKHYPTATWSRTNHFGASLGALAALGNRKGYELVGCNITGANAFFVRSDLCGNLFCDPGSAESHYEPARYFLADLPSGHAAGIAETISIADCHLERSTSERFIE